MHRTRVPRWAVERGRTLNDFPALEAGATALVVVDMQAAFVADGAIYGNPHARDIVGRVNALANAFRTAGAPVIWTRQTHTRSGKAAPAAWQYDESDPGVAEAVAALQAGAPGHALYREMDVGLADLVLDKHRYSAFACPLQALPTMLERLGTRMLVICGTLTNVCCETTARDAYMAGYKVIVVSDACAAVTDAEHNAALLNVRINFADVKRTREVLRMLRSLPSPLAGEGGPRSGSDEGSR